MNESARITEKKPTILRRTLYMTAIWICFGVAIGALDPRFAGGIGMIAAMIAWSIILSVLGVVLGLVGGSYKESMLGGIFGAVVATLTVFVSSTNLDIAMNAIFGLLIGGIIGATCLPWLHTFLKTAKLTLQAAQWMAAVATPK